MIIVTVIDIMTAPENRGHGADAPRGPWRAMSRPVATARTPNHTRHRMLLSTVK